MQVHTHLPFREKGVNEASPRTVTEQNHHILCCSQQAVALQKQRNSRVLV